MGVERKNEFKKKKEEKKKKKEWVYGSGEAYSIMGVRVRVGLSMVFRQITAIVCCATPVFFPHFFFFFFSIMVLINLVLLLRTSWTYKLNKIQNLRLILHRLIIMGCFWI